MSTSGCSMSFRCFSADSPRNWALLGPADIPVGSLRLAHGDFRP
jgi:hypothetical protein